MKQFHCTIRQEPGPDGTVILLYEFQDGLLPGLPLVDEVDRDLPGINPTSYLLGLFIARLDAAVRLSRGNWMIRDVKPRLLPRDSSFALAAIEVSCWLHAEEAAARALSAIIVRQAATWAGTPLDQDELLQIIDAPRQP